MKTDLKTLRDANWDQLEGDVVQKIRILKAAATHLEDGFIGDKIANDLILPNLQLLAEFCGGVTEADE